jgi:hypothetical protein
MGSGADVRQELKATLRTNIGVGINYLVFLKGEFAFKLHFCLCVEIDVELLLLLLLLLHDLCQ